MATFPACRGTRRAAPCPSRAFHAGLRSARVLPRAARSAATLAPASGATGEGATGQQLPVRRLIMLRHAESDQNSGVRDHDRDITDVGRKQAQQVAAMLQDRGWTPDLVLASNSKRTKQTLDEMTTSFEALSDVDAHYYGSLYTVAALDGQTADHLMECLLEVVDDVRNRVVMCVGHNKGWEEAASQFAGTAVKLRTASAALLQTQAASWRDVLTEGATWQLVEVLVPAA